MFSQAERNSSDFSIQITVQLKIEKILKGSLDSILSPLPSVKIQIMGGKICFCFQKFVDNTYLNSNGLSFGVLHSTWTSPDSDSVCTYIAPDNLLRSEDFTDLCQI